MPDQQRNDRSTGTAAEPSSRPVRYPAGYTVGVLDSPEEVGCVLEALSGPFLDSEIEVISGSKEAGRLRAGTGRTGFADTALRFLNSLGIANDEMETKARYERALEEGLFMVEVLTPTEERKELAVRALRACGGHFVNYFGALAREEIVPWGPE